MAGLFIGIGLWVAPSVILLVVVIGVETLSLLRRWTRALVRRPGKPTGMQPSSG